MDKDTSGRSCFSETTRSAPLVSTPFVHVGTRRTGDFPGGGTFFRSSACRADGAIDRLKRPRESATLSFPTFRVLRVIVGYAFATFRFGGLVDFPGRNDAQDGAATGQIYLSPRVSHPPP